MRQSVDKENGPGPLRSILLAGACVLVAEAFVGVLAGPGPAAPPGLELARAALLVVFLVPLFYLLVCRPIEARLSGLAGENRRLEARLAEQERNCAERTRAETMLVTERRRDAALGDLLALLRSCNSTAEACGLVARHGGDVFPRSAGGVYLYGVGDARLRLAASWGAWREYGESFDPADCRALGLGRVHVLPDQQSSLCRHLTACGGQGSICIPLSAHGTTLGVISIVMESPRDGRHAAAHEAIASRMAWAIDLALANIRLREAARQQAVRDPVTGLFNSRYVDESWSRELARAERHATSLGVAVIAIEGITGLAVHGDDVPGAALCEIGYLLNLSLRAEDGAFRVGEEELLLLLPGVPADVLERRVEDIARSIGALCAARGGARAHTVAIACGAALFPRDGRHREELLQTACRNLERAKLAARARTSAGRAQRASD